MKTNLFTALGVSQEIADALQQQGYTEPTPIQKEAIPIVLAGHDVIAQAQTGTGKTLAFVLPILENIDLKKSYTQALIVTPTRELAIQITGEVQKWAPLKGISVLAAYGGQDVERQLKKLEGTIHLIIATPGRLLDHIRRETVQLNKLSTLVLDEADQMLHMGFLKDVEEIIIQTPVKRQTLLFSATMPGPIRNLAKGYMRTPQEIKVKTKQITLAEIEQIVIKTSDRGKQDALCYLIDEYNPFLAMIFCRTKLRASQLNEVLREKGYASDELHGDLTQAKREQVMKKFRDAKIQLLVATDIASRGLDVEGITHVFNYDMPHDTEAYIHRIGRTGRAGQRGMAITLVTQRDGSTLDEIERGINAQLPRRTMKADGELSAEQTSGRSRAGNSDRVSMSTERTERSPGARGRGERSGGARRGAAGGAGRGLGGGNAGRGSFKPAGGWRDSAGGEERSDFGAGAGRGGSEARGGAAGRGSNARPGASRGAVRAYGARSGGGEAYERPAGRGPRGEAGAGRGGEANSLSGLFGRGKGANRASEREYGTRGRGDTSAERPERESGESGARRGASQGARAGSGGGRSAGSAGRPSRDAGAWTTKREAQQIGKASSGRGASAANGRSERSATGGSGEARSRDNQSASGKRGSTIGSKTARPGRKDSGPRGRGGR